MWLNAVCILCKLVCNITPDRHQSKTQIVVRVIENRNRAVAAVSNRVSKLLRRFLGVIMLNRTQYSRVHVISSAVLWLVICVRVLSVIVGIMDYRPCLGLIGQDLTPGVGARDVILVPTNPREPEKHEGRYESEEPSHCQNDDRVGHVEGPVMGNVFVNVRFDLHVKMGHHTYRYPYYES